MVASSTRFGVPLDPSFDLSRYLNHMPLFSSPVGSLCHTRGVVRRPSSVVCRVSSVCTITTRNNKDIKSIFGADVHHVSGLCLLGIGGSPYINHKIMAQKPNFHIFNFFSETTSRWCFILC